MTIKVRLFATLRQGRGKQIQMELDETATPLQIIQKLNIAPEEVAILLINGMDRPLNTQLKHQDTVSVFPPVGGG
ncbi:MAG: MoaD/ThiS family protein [Bacteroidota bacterium]